MVTVHWQSDLKFVAHTPSHHEIAFDAYSDDGLSAGPTPIEALLAAIATCSAMDVVEILRKKKQLPETYRIEIEGVRTEPGVYPRPLESITIRHIVGGSNIEESAVARAVQLSDEKYCGILATLRKTPQIRSDWRIESEASRTENLESEQSETEQAVVQESVE